MKENLLKIILKEPAFIHGRMEDNTKDSGRKIKCMAKVCLHGQTGGSIMVSILMALKRDMENLNGQMEKYIRGHGKMVNNMELELLHPRINKLKKESGSTARK